MGKRKKKTEIRPRCWYCDREFENERVLTNHQKARHFKCHICNKKMNTTGGLAVHVLQVHKETLATIQNALPGRNSPTLEIYGNAGFAESELEIHQGIIDNKKQQSKPANDGINIKNVDTEFLKKQIELFKQSKNMSSNKQVPLMVPPVMNPNIAHLSPPTILQVPAPRTFIMPREPIIPHHRIKPPPTMPIVAPTIYATLPTTPEASVPETHQPLPVNKKVKLSQKKVFIYSDTQLAPEEHRAKLLTYALVATEN